MNHGQCKNCWWYWITTKTRHKLSPGEGFCLMQSSIYEPEIVSEDSYCPDYINRKKEKETLETWIENNFYPEF